MKISVLDHGYIEKVEHWGSDQRIIEAARMSTDGAFRGWGPRCSTCQHAFLADDGATCLTPGCGGMERTPGDEKLLRYLWNHKHATPFEMAGLVVEIQAPIFVFREWHRHRTQSYNELSARYTPLPDLNYLPTVDRLLFIGGANRQAGAASGAMTLDGATAETFIASLRESYEAAESLYQDALQHGVPKEVARLCIPVGRYSRMRASANLRNWLAFLTLRMAPEAQWEIRQFAGAVGELVAKTFPRTWELFSGDRNG